MDYILTTNIDDVVTTLSEHRIFSVDLETTGLNPLDSRILLCQISTGDQTFVMQPSQVDMQRLMPFIKDINWLKIVQNAVFEGKFLKHYYKTDIRNVFDTYLAEKLINSDSHTNSLEDLAQKYAGITLNKKIRSSFFGAKPIAAFSDEQLEYAADDATVLHPIYREQEKSLLENGLKEIAAIEFDLTTVVADMENEGVPINQKLWREKLKVYDERHEQSRLKMNALIFDESDIPEQMGLFVRDGIDLNSPKKVKNAFLELGIDVDSTTEREIALIDHPAAKELLNYRELQKIKSSYGENILEMIHPFDGRLHSDFNQIGTRTGRFASRNPNLQQMPADFRECISLEDHKIVSADFANIELRILAEYSNDEQFIRAFKSGDDPHKSTAAGMFDIALESVSKEQRFIAKTINFGLVYGMGIDKLRDLLNAKREEEGQPKLSYQEVKAMHNKYKRTYWGAIKWLKDAGEQGLARMYSTTMLGRRRVLMRPTFNGDDDQFNRLIGAAKRQAANSPIQGTSADITKLAMLNVYYDLSTYNYHAKIIIQVHDEIVVLAHKKEAESIKDIVVNAMIEAGEQVLHKVPIKVDSNISDTWAKG